MTEKNKKLNTENQITRIMKPLSELNLLDRFLFDEAMEDEQTAEAGGEGRKRGRI